MCEWDVLARLARLREAGCLSDDGELNHDMLLDALAAYCQVHDAAYCSRLYTVFKMMYMGRENSYTDISGVNCTSYRTLLETRKRFCLIANGYIKKHFPGLDDLLHQ